MAAISGFILISLIICLFYMVGFLQFLVSQGENRCDMTYMFQYPQFVEIYVPENLKFPQYGLYAYSEGRLTEKVRDMKFSGVPVLFIPGNAGSYKQARSLASVALRKALDSRPGYHFDFFTVDLNDELSGLSGGLLSSQAKFVNHSLYRILELYPEPKRDGKIKPKSVIVFGHSMGGIIVQNILANPVDSKNIDVLITLAAPHLRAAILFDYYTEAFYQDIDQKWKIKYRNETVTLAPHIKNKTLVTIGAGQNDKLVNTMLTQSQYSTVHVATTAIPRVRLSTDHLSIVWCKQLVLALVRSLFDCINTDTRQLSTDSEYRHGVFRHHLVHNSGTKPRQALRYTEPVKINPIGEWIERPTRQYTIDMPRGTDKPQWYMIRLHPGMVHHKYLSVRATNLEVTDWIFICAANSVSNQSRVCTEGYHLSHKSEIAPSVDNTKRRTLNVDLEELHKEHPTATHVAVKILPSSKQMRLDIDVHDPGVREIVVAAPAWYSFSWTTVIENTAQGSLRYKVKLNGFEQLHQAYFLNVEAANCGQKQHHAVATLTVPGLSHDLHEFFTENRKRPMRIILHSPKPLDFKNETIAVTLTLEPGCQYTVRISSSILDTLAQLTRHYSPQLLANMGAVLLLALRWQLAAAEGSTEQKAHCPALHSALSSATKPYYLITLAKLVSKVLSWKPLMALLVFLPRPDANQMTEQNMEFLLLPLLLYSTATGLVYTLALALWAAIIVSGSAANKLALRFLAKTIAGTVSWSDWLMSGLHRLPCAVAAVLAALSVSTCGGLALCLAMIFYFLKLTKMYEDYLENFVYRSVKFVASKIGGTYLPKCLKLNQSTSSSKTTLVKRVSFKDEQPSKETDEDEDSTSKENLTVELKETDDNREKDLSDEDSERADDKEKSDGDNETSDDLDEEVQNDSEDNAKTEQTTTDSAQSDDSNSSVQVIKQNDTGSSTEENHEEATNKTEDPSLDTIHFHFTTFLIWCLIAGLNVPSVLTWAHNFKYNTMLQPDPSFIPSVVMCVCAAVLWQVEMPKPNLKYSTELGYVLYVLALITLIYAPISVYRLTYTLSVGLIAVTVHQLLAPNSRREQDADAETTVVTEEPMSKRLDLIKAKWE